MRKSIFFLALFIACFWNIRLSAQNIREESIVIIKVIECYANGMSCPIGSRMVIVKPDNTIVERELERANIASGGKEEVNNNMTTLRSEVQFWHSNGFNVSSSSSGNWGTAGIITTIIMSKN